MTSHGSLTGQLDRAIRAGQLRKALDLAAAMPRVPLAAALRICFLLSEARDPRFERAARRWLERLAVERQPSLHQLVMAGGALAEVGSFPNSEVARRTLQDLESGPRPKTSGSV